MPHHLRRDIPITGAVRGQARTGSATRLGRIVYGAETQLEWQLRSSLLLKKREAKAK